MSVFSRKDLCTFWIVFDIKSQHVCSLWAFNPFVRPCTSHSLYITIARALRSAGVQTLVGHRRHCGFLFWCPVIGRFFMMNGRVADARFFFRRKSCTSAAWFCFGSRGSHSRASIIIKIRKFTSSSTYSVMSIVYCYLITKFFLKWMDRFRLATLGFYRKKPVVFF